MQLTPRYDGPPLIVTDGSATDQLAPVVRQRQRLEDFLSALPEEQWSTPSRCDGWRVQDVVTHLTGVTQFWCASISAGAAGTPTRYLHNFDPVATPAHMVQRVKDLSPEEALSQFVATNQQLLALLSSLSEHSWQLPAEAPPGHLPIRLVASHALWDSWIHERDICLPLAYEPPKCDDEIVASLRYVTALSGAFALLTETPAPARVAYVVAAPDSHATIAIGSDSVVVSNEAPPPHVPLLVGDAVTILEALSVRSTLPADAPSEWRDLHGGLRRAFDAN